MKEETYNGWTNYATWRVNLEVIDGWAEYHTEDKDHETFEEIYELGEHLKDYAEETIFQDEGGDGNMLMAGYARAFLDEVNWYEIAKNLADSYPQLMKANEQTV